jgi:hypothetical protein
MPMLAAITGSSCSEFHTIAKIQSGCIHVQTTKFWPVSILERARELASGRFCFWVHREFWFSRHLMASQQETAIRAAAKPGAIVSRCRGVAAPLGIARPRVLLMTEVTVGFSLGHRRRKAG